MTRQHSALWRKQPFRAFVTNQYYANRDEYFACGQQQPHTLEQYYVQNKLLLKQQYRERMLRLASTSAERSTNVLI